MQFKKSAIYAILKKVSLCSAYAQELDIKLIFFISACYCVADLSKHLALPSDTFCGDRISTDYFANCDEVESDGDTTQSAVAYKRTGSLNLQQPVHLIYILPIILFSFS